VLAWSYTDRLGRWTDKPYLDPMKKIGFLSFGHWSNTPHSKTRTAHDTLLQSIDLAVAAEELGTDGAYFRVHHFAQQLLPGAPVCEPLPDHKWKPTPHPPT